MDITDLEIKDILGDINIELQKILNLCENWKDLDRYENYYCEFIYKSYELLKLTQEVAEYINEV